MTTNPDDRQPIDLIALAAALVPHNTHDTIPEHLLHVAAEVGEAADAWNGSPRKGIPSSPHDTALELCDVVLCALEVLNRIAPDPYAAMRATIDKLAPRYPAGTLDAFTKPRP